MADDSARSTPSLSRTKSEVRLRPRERATSIASRYASQALADRLLFRWALPDCGDGCAAVPLPDSPQESGGSVSLAGFAGRCRPCRDRRLTLPPYK
jgi:hypothetical protein